MFRSAKPRHRIFPGLCLAVLCGLLGFCGGIYKSRTEASAAAAGAHALDVARVVSPVWPTHIGLAVEDRLRRNEGEFLAAIRTSKTPLVTLYFLWYSPRDHSIEERVVIEIWGTGKGRYITLDDVVHEFEVSGFGPAASDEFTKRLLYSGILNLSHDGVLLKQILVDPNRPLRDWQENPANLRLSIRLPGLSEYSLFVPPHWETYAGAVADVRVLSLVIHGLFNQVPEVNRARVLPPQM